MSSDQPAATVIVATFNGAATLPLHLQALSQLRAPAGGWNLVVVDNGSTDHTASILRQWQALLPMRQLFEPRRGKNHALNAALPHAAGELVVFTDDDTLPSVDWLVELERCSRRQPECDLFGGTIVPRWPDGRPPMGGRPLPWGMLYSATPSDRPDGRVDCGLVWGANMAVRRSALAAGMAFDISVGPDGTNRYAMGSETEFALRLGRQGVKAWFCASARVEHLVRRSQVTPRWILQRYYRHGRSVQRFDAPLEPARLAQWNQTRWMWRQIVGRTFSAAWHTVCRQNDKAFDCLCDHYFLRGRMAQARLMHQPLEPGPLPCLPPR